MADSATELRALEVSSYEIPTDAPAFDGTFAWNRTTLVLVEAAAGEHRGLGYTYADQASASLAREVLAPLLIGRDARDIPGAWSRMGDQVRNIGRPGAAAMAISAIDVASWDLKAPDCSRPGHGLVLERKDVARYAA
jgi:L-alanine-DL-glutamate epimerase-like enolase superfamily enzyme